MTWLVCRQATNRKKAKPMQRTVEVVLFPQTIVIVQYMQL